MRKLLSFLSISYSVVLLVLSLMKQVAIKELPSYSDKIFHAIAYCLFTLLWFLTLNYTYNLKKKKAISIAVVAAIVFGIIIEVLQQTSTINREGDFKDVIANTLGAFIAVLIINFVTKRKVKN